MAERVYTVKKVSVFGDKIILSDGSKWLIAPDYASKCVGWYETHKVVVKEINGEVYKYQLVNVETADIVDAHAVVA